MYKISLNYLFQHNLKSLNIISFSLFILQTIQLRLTQSDQRSENVISLYRQLRTSTSNT